MPVRRWWEADSSERYWMEITDRQDLGADLHAPQVDGSGNDYWSYSLVREVLEGDCVFHWWKRGDAESALVGWSRASGPVTKSRITWQARGTVGRSRAGAVEQPSWRLPLTGFTELTPPVGLTELRSVEPQLKQVYDRLTAEFGRSLYFPFAFSDRRPLRATQGYLVKFPKGLVEAIPALRPVDDDGGRDRRFVPSTPAESLEFGEDAFHHVADVARRRVIEMYAVDVMLLHLRRQGWQAEHVGTTHPYDIHATRSSDELRMEVKGSTGERLTIELTDGEVQHARKHGATSLAVVDRIMLMTDEQGSPVAFGGRVRLWAGWVPDVASLVAVRYRHLLPPDPRQDLAAHPGEGVADISEGVDGTSGWIDLGPPPDRKR